MKRLLSLLLLVASFYTYGQSSVVYKKNLLTNQIEVYQSVSGTPMGLPIATIKRNVWGYIEVENIQKNEDTYSKRPDYSMFNSKPVELPLKEMFATIETMNKRYEYDYINKENLKRPNNNEFNDYTRQGIEYRKNRVLIANQYLNFYNSNIVFPKKIQDGWYDVVKITRSLVGDKDYEISICKVVNNKVVELYDNTHSSELKTGIVFKKIPFDVMSEISSCKCTFRQRFINEYEDLYFLDNILDAKMHIEDPEFNYFSIHTLENAYTAKGYLLTIFRNTQISRDKILHPLYSTIFYGTNSNNLDCNKSNFVLALKKSEGYFSISIFCYDNDKTWIINDIRFDNQNDCKRTTLNE